MPACYTARQTLSLLHPGFCYEVTVLITPELHCKLNTLLWSLLKVFSEPPLCASYHCAGWMNIICCLIHKAVIKGLSIFMTELMELWEAAGSLQDKEDSKLNQEEFSSNLPPPPHLSFPQVLFPFRQGSGSRHLSLFGSLSTVFAYTV